MNTMFNIEVVSRSLTSVAFPQPNPRIHEKYWVKVYHEGNLITQVGDVDVSYSDDLFDDPEVLFPLQITIGHGVVGNYDLETIKEAIKNEVVAMIKKTRLPWFSGAESYDPGIIIEDDI